MNRRKFIKATSFFVGAAGLADPSAFAENTTGPKPSRMTAADLPAGTAPAPVSTPYFPDRLHTFVWRNWQLVPANRMAEVVGTTGRNIVRIGKSMGLSGPPSISASQQRRSALTVIRRNWHLLPYSQLLVLLGWSAEELAFSLREDDFLFVKLGNLKPRCAPLKYQAPSPATRARAAEIAQVVHAHFPKGVGLPKEPLFDFVNQLSREPKPASNTRQTSSFDPRFCYSYFALYGDPLLDPDLDPYPDGLLARLAAAGANGVWLQAVLSRLAPFPWDPTLSEGYEVRLRNLGRLVERARRRGIGIYLYLNEPRSLPKAFFESHTDLKGVVEGDFATLCTSVPEVRQYLTSAVASICRAVPNLAGFFTISGSENLTNCWSHQGGSQCPRCGKRPPAEVIGELHSTFQEGIRQAGHAQKLIAWDWGWADAWVPGIIAALPAEALFMSVSEWGTPINRGGVNTTIGEYSISTIGPGERARNRWQMARSRGLKTMAKVQLGNTWELSSVPYIPAVQNVAKHLNNLSEAGVNGLMLGWTLGGYPSPNLELIAAIHEARQGAANPVDAALDQVAEHRVGKLLGPAFARAWKNFSQAFGQFPFDGGVVYNAPMQLGPANPLWAQPTGYRSTMVGFPYDDLDGWRALYPPQVFAAQLEKVAAGFEEAEAALKLAVNQAQEHLPREQRAATESELRVAEAATIHFRSTANQARFVLARKQLQEAKTEETRGEWRQQLAALVKAELELARRLHHIQSADSRIGFEASNQYFYVPMDLAEKVINCEFLLRQWLAKLPVSASH